MTDAPATKVARKPAPWRGRRKVADPRDAWLPPIRCTQADRTAVEEAAARAGLEIGPYVRTLVLGSAGPRARRRPPLEREAVAQLLGQVGRVGGNVNQLAKMANTTGNLPAIAALTRAAEDIAALRAALMQALGREMGREMGRELPARQAAASAAPPAGAEPRLGD